ncbi:MAG: LysR family transcriptional regulator [Pontibacterium sp.]
MNIEHLRLFVRLATHNNISQAGHELGLSPAVASAHINKLEKSLGVRLLHRTTRRVSLTEEGEAFLPHAFDVLASVEAARASVGAGEEAPTGTLRISAPASFGRMHLMPAIKAFRTRYPLLSLDLRLTDTMVDLVEGGFDVAVRDAELKDSSLIARKLATDKRIICASPEYLKIYGQPETPLDLRNHQCITLIGLDSWVFNTPEGQKNIKVKGSFRTDNGEATRDACAAGLGITICSTWNAYLHLQRGELVQVLEDYPLHSDVALWAVYPSSRLLAPKVRAFIDFFVEQYGEEPYWDKAPDQAPLTGSISPPLMPRV